VLDEITNPMLMMGGIPKGKILDIYGGESDGAKLLKEKDTVIMTVFSAFVEKGRQDALRGVGRHANPYAKNPQLGPQWEKGFDEVMDRTKRGVLTKE
jgi:hypothetical protein